MSDKSVNIKRLPEASDIEDGNFLIIEGEEGTSILRTSLLRRTIRPSNLFYHPIQLILTETIL